MNIYLKLDVSLPENPRVSQLGVEAECLYVRGLLYCKRNVTDGFIAETVVKRVAHEGTTHLSGAIDQLVFAGLWTALDGGWQVHDWVDRNATRAEIDEKRDAAARRKAAYRDRKARDNMSQRDTESRDAVSSTYRDRDRERAQEPLSLSTIPSGEYPGVNISGELGKFTHWVRANGKNYADLEAAFRLWLDRAWRVPVAEVVEIPQAARARADCDDCAGSGWEVVSDSTEVVKCHCLAEAVAQ